MPQTSAQPIHPQMTEVFARAYDRTGLRIMGPLSVAALDRVRGVGSGTRVLDVGAGTGALSVPAAQRGASVLAIDKAPGMVKLLSEKLSAFPGCEAREMDGQALALDDGSFDAAFSVVGIPLFPDWRRGLKELARVLRSGGKGAVVAWRKLPGGGPFVVLDEALRSALPHSPPMPMPDGFVALSDPERLGDELQRAGFSDVTVEQIDAVWEGPAGVAFLDEMRDMYGFMPTYAALADEDRSKVDEAILRAVESIASNGQVSMRTPALLAIGTRA